MGRFAKLLLRLPGEMTLLRSVANPRNPPLQNKNIFDFDTSNLSAAKDFIKPWKPSCNTFLFTALRSIGLRCMEHLFFLRIVGEVTSDSLITYNKETCTFFLKNVFYFSGEHQRDWLTSLWLVGGWTGLNWDLWTADKSDWTKFQPPCELRDQKTDAEIDRLKIFNHLVFKPTPAMNSIVYVERV